MIFMILCGVLVLAIGFFNYIQGFFSATLAAILTIISGLLAFSLHEWVVESFLKRNANAVSNSMVLLILFGLFYVILRVIFDKSVPAGIVLPAVIDKVGGGIMALVTAAFAVGVFAVAAQEMPFDAAAGGYARYAVQDRAAVLQRRGRGLDASTFGELVGNEPGIFDEGDRKSMYVDDLFIGTVRYVSDGSLSGSQKLTDVHPDFLKEVFAQRLGMQPDAAHIAIDPLNGPPAMSVASITPLQTLNVADFLPNKVRDASVHAKWSGVMTANGTPITSGGPKVDKNQLMLQFRLVFSESAKDKGTSFIRLSPATIRLLANHKDETGALVPTDYYPWGIIDDKGTVFLNKLDDYLLIDVTGGQTHGLDVLFVVDKDGFLGDSKPGNEKIAENVFIEYKRMSRESLGSKVLSSVPKALNGVAMGVIQPERPFEGTPAVATTPQPAAQPARGAATQTARANTAPNAGRGSFTSAQQNVASIGGKSFNYASMSKSTLLPAAVAVPADAAGKSAMITVDATGVTALMQDKKFRSLTVDPKVSMTKLGAGEYSTRELAVPEGQQILQITGNQPNEPWQWAQQLNTFKLQTSDNKRLAPYGAWAVVSFGGEDRLIAQYSMSDEAVPFSSLPSGPPKLTGLIFLMPNGVEPRELFFGDQTVKVLQGEPITK
ncbi:MAG TPA: hypothetical protein VH370_23410 [Humisphaera sp.]|jgi:hypothetical protein|nr:hypothetical protein [Humisphaera sp.]